MAMSSAVLHLLGAAAGFPLAIAMLRLGWVDCEHWDVFSVWSGRNTMTPRNAAPTKSQPAQIKQRMEEAQQRRTLATSQIRELIQTGQPLFALKAHSAWPANCPTGVCRKPICSA